MMLLVGWTKLISASSIEGEMYCGYLLESEVWL